jgi:ribosomal protein S3
MIFRYLYYVLRYLFKPLFATIGVRGVKFQLKGKVSVAGNARTRTIRNRVGDLSYATYNNKIILDLNLIRTFTGVIGFKT